VPRSSSSSTWLSETLPRRRFPLQPPARPPSQWCATALSRSPVCAFTTAQREPKKAACLGALGISIEILAKKDSFLYLHSRPFSRRRVLHFEYQNISVCVCLFWSRVLLGARIWRGCYHHIRRRAARININLILESECG
jgi:hypothetical protein